MILKYKTLSLLLITFTLFINSCASTTMIFHKIGSNKSLCKNNSALILWGTSWRVDQKEKKLREDIAEKSISSYFSKSKCFSNTKILKEIDGKPTIELSDIEAINLLKKFDTNYDKIIFIRVEELGPILNLSLSLVLVEGATEVKLRTRVIDTKTLSLDYDSASQWRNGGAYIIKGVATLENDMIESMKTIFEYDN